jgi:hypothetical protein
MTELVATQPSDLAITPSFHAVAINATAMKEANTEITQFLVAKCNEVDNELAEMTAAYDTARTRKWASSALHNQVNKITKRKVYYDKLLDAVNAGYTLVPNMPCDVFAIRTDRNDPKWFHKTGTSQYGYSGAAPSVPDEKERLLPSDEGTYQNPLVSFTEDRDKVKMPDGKELYRVTQRLPEWRDMEFPLAAAHSVVMEATDDAMKKLIFDRIGIVPQETIRRGYRGDPIVLGQIVRRDGYSEKVTSFLIAWHLDMRTL